MLESLDIKNIILIDNLHIDFKNGLCVLTGETGSGKSILLDALMMALGSKVSVRLLRNGEKQGSVEAIFNIENNDKVKQLLEEQDIEFDDTVILRRTINEDGKSKAFVNNVGTTQSFLQLIGKELIEIHGQHDQTSLLNSSFHREILDEYGELLPLRNEVSILFETMKNLEERFKTLNEEKENIEKEKDYLQNSIKELEDLDIQENEEEELNEKRISMMNKEKVIDILNSVKNIIDGVNPISKQIVCAENYLSRGNAFGENLLAKGKNAFEDIIDDFERGIIEINEGIAKVNDIYDNLDYSEEEVNKIEERLFLIRNLSRKYNIQSIFFNDFIVELKKKLEELENQTVEMNDIVVKLDSTKKEFLEKAKKLSQKRKETGQLLAKELMEELIPLKMDKVVFDVDFKELSLENANKYGIDNVKFLASTNIGTKLDELSNIASGGELSRFMLALKVVLSKIHSVPTMIFDEIDTGVSGAVADAIGERLKKLGNNLQVFVITHLPQVASKGSMHIKVSKESDNNTTRTKIEILDKDTRITEIAKMISGETITKEAINMAKILLK